MGISSESHFVTRSYDLAKEDDMQVAATGVKRISTRIKRGFLNRALQSEQLKTHLENCPYPIILLGDFNDTPCSYAYTTLAEDLNDSFVTAGRGLSNSFNGIYPSYRIDYILFDKHFISFDYRRSKLDLSDHFPISSNFYFSEN
jgi:endonuclease/exonuclease/phosphatase family metal-dependent hydrolase